MSNLNDLITDVMVKNCQIDLHDWAGITMTDAQVRDMLSDEDPFVATLLAYYRNDADAHGLDTQDRDTLFDIVARKLLGRNSWPLNKDNDGPALEEDIRRALRQGKIEAFEG